MESSDIKYIARVHSIGHVLYVHTVTTHGVDASNSSYIEILKCETNHQHAIENTRQGSYFEKEFGVAMLDMCAVITPYLDSWKRCVDVQSKENVAKDETIQKIKKSNEVPVPTLDIALSIKVERFGWIARGNSSHSRNCGNT